MTDSRRETLRALAEIWELSEEVRLGQLMAHLGFLGECHVGRGLGDIEDDELLAIVYRHRAELTARVATSQDIVPPVSSLVSVSGNPTSADIVKS